MEVNAIARYIRLSPVKGRDMAAKLTGMQVNEALGLTELSERKAGFLLGKVLKSALANAEHNNKLAVDDLWIKKAVVLDGPRLRRFWASARGMALRVEKKMCHIKIVLSDEARGKKRQPKAGKE
jgi:large subunit ribosomal protein L22